MYRVTQRCSVRGSVVALDTRTVQSSGRPIWRRSDIAELTFGAATRWLMTLATRCTLVPATITAIPQPMRPARLRAKPLASALADPHCGSEAACLASNDYVDSIVALNMSTGAVKLVRPAWSTGTSLTSPPTAATIGMYPCITAPDDNCPSSRTGPDYDFGSAPNEITYKTAHGSKTIIGAGTEDGIYYALDPDTGALLWADAGGAWVVVGGMEWGSASDGQRIYVAISDFYGIPWRAAMAAAGLRWIRRRAASWWTTPRS